MFDSLMKTIALILSLLSFAPLPALVRAETLAEIAASAGVDWIIGKWATEDGNVAVAYTWKLDKNAIGVTFKTGDREAEGMIMRKPGTKDVIYGAADNKGGMSAGKWIEYNEHPTLISTHTDADGTEKKMAAEHIKTDDDTMTVKLYAVGDDGKPDPSKSGDVVFKRQK